MQEIVESLAAIPVLLLARFFERLDLVFILAWGLNAVGIGFMWLIRKGFFPGAYVAVGQTFVGLAGAAFNTMPSAMVVANQPESDQVRAIALHAMFACLGSVFGNAIGSAIWNNVFPSELDFSLGSDIEWREIYRSLTVQLSYSFGSDIRKTIGEVYVSTLGWIITPSFFAMFGAGGCIYMLRRLENENRLTTDEQPGVNPDGQANLIN